VTPLFAGRPGNEAPAGWRWFRLTDLARLETGHTPSRNHPEWWGGPIPWISLADIRELDGKVAQDTIEHTNEEGIANSSARLLPEGTVVLSRTASVGFVTIMGRPMATSQDFVNWVCGPELDPHFLAYLLRASRDYIRSLSSGAIHQTVYMPSVESFFVSAPSIRRQREISESLSRQLAAVERARAVAERQIGAINALPT
jgi:type I restriction enzyme, S subunit